MYYITMGSGCFGEYNLSFVQRLFSFQSVHYQRFHCIYPHVLTITTDIILLRKCFM